MSTPTAGQVDRESAAAVPTLKLTCAPRPCTWLCHAEQAIVIANFATFTGVRWSVLFGSAASQRACYLGLLRQPSENCFANTITIFQCQETVTCFEERFRGLDIPQQYRKRQNHFVPQKTHESLCL